MRFSVPWDSFLLVFFDNRDGNSFLSSLRLKSRRQMKDTQDWSWRKRRECPVSNAIPLNSIRKGRKTWHPSSSSFKRNSLFLASLSLLFSLWLKSLPAAVTSRLFMLLRRKLTSKNLWLQSTSFAVFCSQVLIELWEKKVLCQSLLLSFQEVIQWPSLATLQIFICVSLKLSPCYCMKFPEVSVNKRDSCEEKAK